MLLTGLLLQCSVRSQMQGTGVQLSQSLTRATQAAMIYTLTFPLNVRTPLRPPELGADEPAWVAEVRAVAVQAAKEGAHISHVVVLRSG
jgi:hypothetical protein